MRKSVFILSLDYQYKRREYFLKMQELPVKKETAKFIHIPFHHSAPSYLPKENIDLPIYDRLGKFAYAYTANKESIGKLIHDIIEAENALIIEETANRKLIIELLETSLKEIDNDNRV